MVCIISGSNRKDNYTLPISKKYLEIFKEEFPNEEVRLIDLAEIDLSFVHGNMYDSSEFPEFLRTIQDETIIESSRFVVISPEYNGSYPGILKTFIDALSVRNYKKTFGNKLVALVGIASGRAGNLRGMDHLSSVFSHMGGVVIPGNLPISSVKDLVDKNMELSDQPTISSLRKQAKQLMEFSLLVTN
jgi:chromate reductase, NAD(P)H dehydrogenase (quinone)